MREKLTNYIRAGYPGVCLLTHEETRAKAKLRKIKADEREAILDRTIRLWRSPS